jgi:hypothetical protein
MSPIIPALTIILAQAAQPSTPSKSFEWCFETTKGVQLCQETLADCVELHRANDEIASSRCKRIEPPEIQISPTEPPAPPKPEKQTPTQR